MDGIPASKKPGIRTLFSLRIPPITVSARHHGLFRLHRCDHALRSYLLVLYHGSTLNDSQGDSLTETWAPGSFGQRMAEYYSRKCDVIVRGFGGEYSAPVLLLILPVGYNTQWFVSCIEASS